MSNVRPQINVLPPPLAAAPKPMLVLLAGVLVGAAAWSFTEPFHPWSVLIKLSLLGYLAWGVVGGRKSALVLLTLLFLFSIGLCVSQVLDDPDSLSLDSVVQGAWASLLAVTAAYLCFAPAARRHYSSERDRTAAASEA